MRYWGGGQNLGVSCNIRVVFLAVPSVGEMIARGDGKLVGPRQKAESLLGPVLVPFPASDRSRPGCFGSFPVLAAVSAFGFRFRLPGGTQQHSLRRSGFVCFPAWVLSLPSPRLGTMYDSIVATGWALVSAGVRRAVLAGGEPTANSQQRRNGGILFVEWGSAGLWGGGAKVAGCGVRSGVWDFFE